jgi:hypothetical protein
MTEKNQDSLKPDIEQRFTQLEIYIENLQKRVLKLEESKR